MKGVFNKFLFAAMLFALSAAATAQDIVVGQSAPLTGGNAAFGADIRDGALAYFKKVNDAGGINGRSIRLETLDDKNDAKLSGPNAKQLIEQKGAVALFGFASSTLSLPAMPAVKANKVPFFAPFTGADTIRKQGEYVYTTRVTYADEIEKLIGFWAPLGVTKVLVLHYDDEVGKQNFQTVERALMKYQKVPTSLAIKRNADLPADIAKRIIAADPQIILATTLAAPIIQIRRQLTSLNKPYSITSLSFASLGQIQSELGGDAAGITVALTVPPPNKVDIPVVAECAAAWNAAGQSRPMTTTALEACISAKVLVAGMRRAGNPTRGSLHKALSSIGRVNVGGIDIAFRPGFNHGGTYVDIAIIRRNGELRV
ncbi:MAG: ABC transporter substrate-binding protein [Burkholderiales bacterium]|jgi:branched-chain amino acid transport system substrate-binding protein